MGTIIMIGVIALTLGGAFWSYNSSQQAIGRAEAVAEFERQQKEVEQANTLRALEGEQYALKLLEAAKRRNQVQAAQLVAAQKQRETVNAEREKVDPELKAWGDTAVPLFAAASLRQHAQSITAAAGSRGVSGVPGVAPGTPIAEPAGASEQSWFDRLRERITRSSGNRVE
jgi:hypothetical protein